MRVPDRHRRRLQTILGWVAAVGFVVGTILLYRWAEPSVSGPSSPIQPASIGSNVTISLENAPFVGHSGGFKTWSLQAGKIDLERMPGSSLASIESVSLTNIKDGLLFPTPPPTVTVPPVVLPSGHLSAQTNVNQIPPEAEVAYGPWTAQFHAGRGHYSSGMTAQPPPELAQLYRLQSVFDLSQSVVLRTREGDRFEADSVTVLDLQNKRNGHTERRILCNNGMKLTRKDAQVAANQSRFDVTNRTVECLGGAHVTFPDGVFQTERMYWTLDQGVLRCPEITTGTLQGLPFTAQGLTIDMKTRTTHANHIHFDLRNELQGKLHF